MIGKFQIKIRQWVKEIENGFFAHAMSELDGMRVISKDNSAETICLAVYKHLVANYDHVQWSCVATRSQLGTTLYATVKKLKDSVWVKDWKLEIKMESHTGAGMGVGATFETPSRNDRELMVYVCE